MSTTPGPVAVRSSPVARSIPAHVGRWLGASTLGPAWISSLLLWASFPPLGLGPLGWLAPLGWLIVIRRPALVGRRPGLALWSAGFVFWLLSVEWLRHAHPAAAVGALALAAYLGGYVWAFVLLARVAVHRWRWPLVAAAPVVWVGLELVRGHLLGGFTFSCLGHTQHRWLAILQIADLGGAYAVSGLVMLVAAALVELVPGSAHRRRWWPLGVALAAVAGALGYAQSRMGPALEGQERIALIQGATPTEVKHDPARHEQVWREHYGLSREAAAARPRPACLIWPETMFREPLYTWSDDVSPPAGANWTVADLQASARHAEQLLGDTARSLGTRLVVGLDVLDFGPGTRRIYNSAVQVSPQGQLEARYDKMHPVMFGEYVPLGNWIPALYGWLPVPQGLEVGTRHASFQVGSLRGAANICYECTLPQLLRYQVQTLAARGEEPEVLVNLTNNGYYGGAAELDLILISCVMRAIEFRKPHLVAANCGFSAWIDGDGRIRSRGPRQQTAIVWAQPAADSRRSLYLAGGDWFAGGCLACCLAMVGTAIWDRWRPRRGPEEPGKAAQGP